MQTEQHTGAPDAPDYESPADYSRRSGLSISTIYRQMRAGELRAIRVGRKTLIDVKAALAALAAQPAWTPQTPAKRAPQASA